MQYNVCWQYVDSSSGKKIGPQLAESTIQLDKLLSGVPGSWVAIFIEKPSATTLPAGANADECRAVLANGSDFAIPDVTIRPEVDVAQCVPFLSASVEDSHGVVVTKDGKVKFVSLSDTFSGKTEALGSVSLTWFV